MTAPDGRRAVRRRVLSVEEYVQGVLAGDRTLLARAITLVESRRPEHFDIAQQVLDAVLPRTGGAHRIGITGVPGVGKSTFIEALGGHLTRQGHQVAVLAVDPSSSRSGGSILGDKTRMARLAVDPDAFIRPSPSGGYLGGVNRVTRETLLLCEAAGFDVVLVETVGAGQSETMVAEMTDFFLVLMLPGAGDDLQGIKKGVLEIADMIAINKMDADPIRAGIAKRDYESALHMMVPASPNWTVPVQMISSLNNQGLEALWDHILAHKTALTESGELAAKRRSQQLDWMWTLLKERVVENFLSDPERAARIEAYSAEIRNNTLNPTRAVQKLLDYLA